MTDFAPTTTPLTRREAREIERRTGRRAVAGAVAPVALSLDTPGRGLELPNFVHDTAEILRNDDTAVVSVLPTEVISRAAARAAGVPVVDSTANVSALDSAGDAEVPAAFARPVSIRAARPSALVARSRRRAVVGLGVAASAAVLASAAVAVPGAVAEQSQQQAGQAALVTADVVADGSAQVDAPAAEAAVPTANLVAAPESATDRGQYAVTSFDAGTVEEVVVTPEPTPESTSDSSTGGSTGSSSGSSSSGSSSSGSSSSGSSSSGSSNGGSGYTGGGDTSGIAGIAQSMMGGGSGWLCTDFTRAVYAQAGITLPGGGVSSQAAGGTQTSNPQVGDLVIFSSGHVGIYAGGDMMWDNPGFNSSYVGWQNVYRSMSVIGSSYYFVTYR